MQTFLPYPDFKQTAKVLDYRRLGKQRIEARMIYDIITGAVHESPWRNHPAVRMWRGFERTLAIYHNIIILEWIERRYTNRMPLIDLSYTIDSLHIIYPTWFNNDKVFASHRAALLAKNFEYYSKFGWIEEPKIAYIWPV